MRKENGSGIYMIYNLENSKIYIGSSNNLRRRKCKHFHELKKQVHCNNHLQRAYNKYGKDKFRFFKIEDIDNEDLMIPRESYWIELLKADYNIVRDISSRHINSRLCKKVLVYSPEGNFIEKFNSLALAMIKYGGAFYAAVGKKPHAKNKIFILESDFSNKLLQNKIDIYNRSKIVFKDARIKHIKEVHLKNKKIRTILQFSKDNKLIKEWKDTTPTIVAREMKVAAGNLTNMLNNKAKTCLGFIWKYKIID